MTGTLADQLEVWGFEDDFIIFSDGSFGFGLKAIPLDVTCWDEDRVNSLGQKIGHFLNELPSDLHIQFIQDIGFGNEKIIETHEALGAESQNEVARELLNARLERLRTLETQGAIPLHSLKIFVRKKFSTPLLSKPKLISRPNRFETMSESQLERELSQIRQLRDNITHALRTLEIESSSLVVNEIAELMYWQWNPTRPIPPAEYNPEDVRHSILFTCETVPATVELLSHLKSKVQPKKWAWCCVAFWFGLRPHEVDSLNRPSSKWKLNESCDPRFPILFLNQSKLIAEGLHFNRTWKAIPAVESEQKDALKIIRSGQLERSSALWFRKHCLGGQRARSFRKGFNIHMRNLGYLKEDRQKWMGHQSGEMMDQHYEDNLKVSYHGKSMG